MGHDWKPSVRTRVTVGATAVLTVALLVAAVTMAALLRRALLSDIDTELTDRVNEIQDLIGNNTLQPSLPAIGRSIGQVQVIDANDTVVAATPGLAASTDQATAPARLDVIDPPPVGAEALITTDGRQIGFPPGRYQVMVRTVASPRGPLAVYAVSSLGAADKAQRLVRGTLLVGIPILVLVAGFITFRVVARALAPVEAMRAEVDRIEATDLSGRVQAPSSDDEIARLGGTLNRMLERLEESAARQQLFAAAASHELRSPLSAIRTELEVGLAYPDRADWEWVATEALVEVARLEELSRDLRVLTNSRVVTASARSSFDLGELVRAEVGRRQPARGVTYRCELGPGPLQADREAVTRVIRNLFDNAERHAAHWIEVSTTSGPDGVRLVVANDGDPIPESEQERIFEPFWRLDEARTLDVGGSGLGLAIARSIMVSHQGTLAVAPAASSAASPGTGVAFLAHFPPTPTPDADGAGTGA